MKALKSVFAAVVAASSSLSFAVPRPAGLVDLTSPTGKASSPVSFYKGNAARVFQDNADITGGDNVRIIYDKTKSGNEIGRFAYTFDTATVVNSYGIGVMDSSTQTSGRAPCKWNFYGSNDYDGDKAHFTTATWEKIDERSGETACALGEYRYYEFENADAYTSYMIAFEAMDGVGDNYIQFAYLEFFNNDMADISNAFLHRVQNGNWKAEMTMGGTMPEALYLDLSALNAGTVSIALPADGTLSGDALAAVDKTIAYSASYRAVSASGQVAVCKLPGKYFFGNYAAKTPADYAKTFSVAVADDVVGMGVNMVVPVRLSEAAISGFSYDDFQQPDYSDLLVTDEFGNALPYEVASWNPAGESLLWVRFPRVAAGSVIQFYYGGPSADVVPARTWESYTGVWHLDELTGEGNSTYANSSLLGSVADGTKAAVSASAESGRFGKACYITSAGVKSGDYMKGGVVIPYSAGLGFGSTFTVSGWFKHKNQNYYYDRMLATRGASGSTGFTVEMYNGWTTAGQPMIKGGSQVNPKIAWPDTMCSDWGFCTFVFDGVSYSIYQNGELFWTRTATAPVTDSELPFTIGNVSLSDVDGDGNCAWCGWADEIRLAGGVAMSADEIAWEYGVATNASLLVFGHVSGTDVSQALIVASNINGMGECNPALGVHEDQTAVEAEPGDVVAKDGVIYDVAKYTIATSDDAGLTWSDPVEHEGRSYSYVPDGRFTRLTWTWEPVAVAVQAASSHATGAVSCSVDPVRVSGGTNYYAVGTTLTLTATDPAASSFREWYGAGEGVAAAGNVATVTVGERPVSLCAVSRHRWVYADKTLSDGAWSCAASLSGTEVTFKSVTTTPECGILDFTDGITDAAGTAEYVLVKFENSALAGNQKLRAVSLMPGLQQLGWNTFQSCTNLVTFSPLLPSSLSYSNNGQVFDGCSSLTGAIVFESEKVRSFGNKMFAGTKVTSLTAPYLEDISGGDLLESCTAVTNVVIPSIVKIGGRSFRGCTALRSVTLGESLEVLGSEAFNGCTALTTVSPLLPASLKTMLTSEYKGTLNSLAFNGCTSLTGDVKLVNAEMKDVYGQVFQNTAITSLYVPHATNIWKYALNNCSAITNITFGAESVRDTGYYPIFGNPKSLEIYFPGKAPILDFASGERSFGNQNYIRVYGDPQMDPDGWGMLLAGESVVMPTVDELARADYPGPRTLGVLTDRNNTRVWLVRYRSPLRKSGMTVIFR